MKKKTAGLLVGLAAGLGVAWLFRDKLVGLLGEKNLTIKLKTVTPGVKAGVAEQPNDVMVFEHQRITWNVVNDSDKDVLVTLANWNDGSAHPRRPAVDAEADPGDHDEPAQDDLSRLVPKGKKRKIRGKARRAASHIESVHYEVHLDNEMGVDPIVRLVL